VAQKVLFLLAGYSGVGKTTLLLHALKQQVPLFGTDDDALFRTIQPPLRLPEHETPIEDILKQGTWFAETHLPALARLESLPDLVLMHLDLNQMVTTVPDLARSPPTLLDRLPRTMRGLADEEENLQFFVNVLSDPFFKRFDRIVVNTLYAPWEVISRQWNTRRVARKKRGRASMALVTVANLFRAIRHAVLQVLVLMRQHHPLPRKRYLFDFKWPGEAIHQAIYRAWFRAVDQMKPDLMLTADVRDGRLTLTAGGQVIVAQPFAGPGKEPAYA
jgi:hypothetical protein